MELYKEILARALAERIVETELPMLGQEAERILNLACYRALEKIKAVIDDDGLSDGECFAKIEEIVCIFEELGSGAKGRHDFG